MRVIGIGDIVELNKRLAGDGLDYRIHLHDACGLQTCEIERLESGGCEDTEEAAYGLLEGFFAAKGETVQYSPDRRTFWLKQ